MTGKKIAVRVGFGLFCLLAGAGAWAALNATALQARFTARQLRDSGDDDMRARAAVKLTTLGDPGLARLIEFIRTGDEPCRDAAVRAIDQRLDTTPDGDPWAGAVAGGLLGAGTTSEPAAQLAVLELLPALLKRTGQTHVARAREVVGAGLKGADPAARALAARLSMHPEVRMRAAVVPLLDDPDATVRCAALVAVATLADGESLVSDEDLFRWLHDPDPGVRQVCHGVLVSHDRTEAEISLGQRLTNPDPRERLQLLLDLRYDEELADPEPWLERLGRDIEPAVRAGAARVALEVSGHRRLGSPAWVARIADADPDPTVRRVASYFRSVPLRTAAGEIRQLGAP